MTTTKNTIDAKQRFAVTLVLSAHCKAGNDGYAVYEDGWNDERVAKEAGLDPEKNVKSVANMRVEAIGKLRIVTRDDKVEERIRDLEQKFAAQILHTNTLITKYNKLIDTLSVNKIIDVRHLKV